MTSAAPGWYTDPAGAPLDRWWDGAGWTQYVQPAGTRAYQAEMLRLARRGSAAGTLARIVIGLIIAVLLVVLLAFVIIAAQA